MARRRKSWMGWETPLRVDANPMNEGVWTVPRLDDREVAFAHHMNVVFFFCDVFLLYS
jgi:hypothetical protein